MTPKRTEEKARCGAEGTQEAPMSGEFRATLLVNINIVEYASDRLFCHPTDYAVTCSNL